MKSFFVVDQSKFREKIKNSKSKVIDARYNFYGCGSELIKEIASLKNSLFVTNLEEGIKLRTINSELEIICEEKVGSEYIYDAIINNLIISIRSFEELKSIIDLNLKDQVGIYLVINVNQDYQGIKTEDELKKCLDLLKDKQKITLKGIYGYQSKKQVDLKFFEKYGIDFLVNGINFSDQSIYRDLVNLYSKVEFALDAKEKILGLRLKQKGYWVVVSIGLKDGIYPLKKVVIKTKACKVKKILTNKLIIYSLEKIPVDYLVEIPINQKFLIYNSQLPIYYKIKGKILNMI